MSSRSARSGESARRQPQRVVGQRGRLLARAAGPGAGRGGRDRRRERLFGPVRRVRQVQRAPLLVADHAGQLCVQRRLLGDRCARDRRGREQRVRRADAAARRRPGRPPRRARESGRIADRLQLRDAQVRAQRDGQQQLAHRPGQLRHARAEQVLDRAGTGMPSPIGGGPRAASVRPTSSAKSGLPSVASKRRRRTCRGRLRERRSERIRRAVASVTGPTATRVSVRASSARSSAQGAGTAREQEPDRLVGQPPGGEAERFARFAVQPLDVVDRDHERLARRQPPQGVEQAQADRMRLRRRSRRVGRGRARRPARAPAAAGARRAPRADSVEHVDQRRERELRLGAARPCREHAAAALPGKLGGSLPERRLAESGAALEHERLAAAGDAPELAQQRKLGLTAGDPAELRSRIPHVRASTTAPDAAQQRAVGSADADRQLSLRMPGMEVTERVGGLRQVVGALDRQPQAPVRQRAARRSRFFRLGSAMTFVRPAPSPAPPFDDDTRAPAASAASYVPGA